MAAALGGRCFPWVWLCRRAWPGGRRHYRAARCAELKQPLAIEEVAPRPVGPHEVRVDVHFCGVNFADILVCRGQYQEKPHLPFTPGMEFSGTVLETGTEVITVKEGDRVIGVSGFNSMAEECITDQKALWRIPDRVPLREAAILPVSYGTAIMALEHRARSQPGETVLVTAAAGATGLAVIDVATNVLQAKVIAAAGSDEKCQLAMQRGAQSSVNYSQGSLKEAVRKLVGSGGVNVVIDTVGGDIFLDALRSLAWEGRIVVVGFAGGTIASVPANLLLLKNISAMGVYWGRYQDRNFPVFSRSLSSALQYCQEGRIQPYVGAVFKLEEEDKITTQLTKKRETFRRSGMEPWIPQQPLQPRGRPPAPSQGPDRGLRRDGYHRPVPHSWHKGERFHQWQDIRGSPQPQQDPKAEHQQPHYVPRPGEWHQPVAGVDYYEGGYHPHLYSRPGIDDPYQRYHSSVREEYPYGSYYYHGHPQQQPEERVPRQASPYIRHEDYRDQKYLNEHHRENQKSPFGTNSETQFQSQSGNPYRDSPASNSGQEWPGDLLPESVLTGAQKNKPPLPHESNLLQQHESGLSSSGYELSQYMADASEPYVPTASTVWRPVQAAADSAADPKAPMKFYIPHVPASFGPGGQLVCVCPSSPSDGQTALVELHSMEVILNDSEEQEEMRTFSGPLIREDVHKVDIMTFCQQKAAQSRQSETPGSRDAALLWQLLVLLCRQNGSMVGSDIAELLMQDCKKLEKYKRQPPVANLINLTDDSWPVASSGTPNLLTGEIPPSVETPAQIVEKFTKLLYYGRKKEALEWAMKNHLWGHALFLSSKMDPRTYNWVMSGFTSTLALNDPLQTLFQLMSGRIPQAATCCGDKQWGDWRPHLAVILSNQGGDLELHQRAIVTMGDTLAGKGLVEAAHFCYLMAHVPFGYYTVKTDHLALLGSSHSQEFLKFATTEAIQRTEIFEYCQMLGRPQSFIPSFQVYKLLYASRLADYGLASQALHYCEAVGTALLSQGESSHPVLLGELIKLAEKLKLSDPLVLERRRGERDLEPDWLVRLRKRHQELERKASADTGNPHSAHTDISGAQGTTGNTCYQDFSGHRGDSEATGDPSARWPPVEPVGPAWPSPQQPLPLQPGSYPAGGDLGQTGVPVPLYSVPEARLPGIGGGMAVTEAPGGRPWAETQQPPPPPAENTMSQGTFQHPDGQKVVSKPQVPLISRAQNISENSTVSAKEEEESSSDETDKKSSPDTARREKSSGFGWFSWFRSKPTHSTSPSGDEDSSDSPDSEETPRASSPPQAGSGLSLTPLPEPPSLPGPGTFSRGTGGGEVQGPASSGGTAEVTGNGGLSGLQGVSSEAYFNPGALLPPAPLKGAVPLYNPSQVPQLSTAASLSRPSRLAQRRYPTQP